MTTKKLTVAMFLGPDSSTIGGIQEHTYFLAKELVKMGHRVTIFGTAPTKKFSNFYHVGKSIKVPTFYGDWLEINFIPRNGRNLSKIMNKKAYDICHIQEAVPLIAWDLLKNATAPRIVTFHFAWDKDSAVNIITHILPFVKKTFSTYANGVIYVSNITKKSWSSLCEENIQQKVIFNGLDHSYFYPINKKVIPEISILFLARLMPRKGLIYLLKAFKLIAHQFPLVKLIIVGDGPEKARCQKYVAWHNLQAQVSFIGAVLDMQKKAHYYQTADIYCAPFVDEAHPLSILEALACGCPVVGFKNESFNESLRDYPTKDLIVKPRDIQALSLALTKAIGDRKLRLKLSKWGIKEAKKYSWTRTAKETEKFYYQILNEYKP